MRIARPNHYQAVYQGNVENVTVAQGGRRIGIDGWGESRNIDFQNYSWSVGSATAFHGYRQFLETDTAFTDYETGSAMLTVRGAGNPGVHSTCAQPSTPAGRDGATSCYLGPIATTGEWAHVDSRSKQLRHHGCGSGVAFYAVIWSRSLRVAWHRNSGRPRMIPAPRRRGSGTCLAMMSWHGGRTEQSPGWAIRTTPTPSRPVSQIR